MQEEQDARLLQLLLTDSISLPVLLHWLDAHHGPGPPPASPPADQNRFHLQTALSSDTDDSINNMPYMEQMAATNPQSFAVTFLNYVRTNVQPLVAAADIVANPVTKSLLPSCENDGTQLLEKKAEEIAVPEPVKLSADASSRVSKKLATNVSDVFPSLLTTKLKDRRKSSGGTQPVAITKSEVTVYEDDFPALGKGHMSNIQKSSAQSKQKRRVTPTPMANPVVDSAFIMAKVEAPLNPLQNHSNNAKFPGTVPLRVDMDILMQRCEKNRKQKQKEKPEILKKSEVSNPCTFEGLESRPATSTQGNTVCLLPTASLDEVKVAGVIGSQHSGSPRQTTGVSGVYRFEAKVPAPTLAPAVPVGPGDHIVADKERELEGSGSSTLGTSPPRPLSKTLTKMAAVHSTLMLTKLVPSLLEELHLLLQLLSLEPAFVRMGPCDINRPLDTIAEVAQQKDVPFCSGGDCAGYACAVLEQAGQVLDCVGEHLLLALIEEPAIAHHSSSLLLRLKASLADQQAAALRSFKAYEAASRDNGAFEQSPNGSTLRLRNWTIPGLPVSLPFQATRDSRNIFKTQEEQRAYNNREQCRDHFYAIMREGASAHTVFGWVSSGSEGEGYRKMKEAVKHFLQILLVENYPWFAELFLEQVLQVSSCGETDPEVTSLAKQDPAKLQRLHDRLTSTTSTRPTVGAQKQGVGASGGGESRLTLSPSSPWSQVKGLEQRVPLKKAEEVNDFHVSNVQVLNKGRSIFGNAKGKSSFQVDDWSRFSSYFPQALCVYIWFLEAADSHRLNTQMIWSIKDKIGVLTELPPYSRDSADIGSGFTQRVLALKALAGLLGYLFVSPGAGARPPAPGPGASTRMTWDVSRSEPPINVPAILGKAQSQGSIILNLPWVLEFLRLLKACTNPDTMCTYVIREEYQRQIMGICSTVLFMIKNSKLLVADWQALSHPRFQTIVSALRDLYLLPMLDPSNPHFGVGSICILASLDGFFEYMELSPSNLNETPKKGRSNISSPGPTEEIDIKGMNTKRETDVQAREEQSGFEGLDTMLGIVDTRYIQHCCPLLVDLRRVLLEGKKRRQRQQEPSWPDSPGIPRARSIRKITPVQRTGPHQSLDISGSVMVGENITSNIGSNSYEDQLKLKLQRTFLEQRPHLRRVVDFIVDTVAGNAAKAAALKFLPSALQSALEKLQTVLSSDAVGVFGAASPVRGGQVETAAEHIITVTIHQVMSAAFEYAKLHAAERTAEALAALAEPEESSFVLGVAAGIAAETAGSAACQKALASISGEIRKRITDDAELWRRKVQLHLLGRDLRDSRSCDSLEMQTRVTQGAGGTSTLANHLSRFQSSPGASKQRLPPVDSVLSSNLESLEQPSGESGPQPISVSGVHTVIDSKTENEVAGGDRLEVSPQHLTAQTGAYMSTVQSCSSVEVAKSNMTVKRQLSFTTKGRTTVTAEGSIGGQASFYTKDQTETRHEKQSISNSEALVRRQGDDAIVTTQRSAMGVSADGKRRVAICLEELMKGPREFAGPGSNSRQEGQVAGQEMHISRASLEINTSEKVHKQELPTVTDAWSDFKQPPKAPDKQDNIVVKLQDSDRAVLLAGRLTQLCSKAQDCCSMKPFEDEKRNSLRHYLAALCVSLECILSRFHSATPPGGFDSLVFQHDPSLQLSSLLRLYAQLGERFLKVSSLGGAFKERKGKRHGGESSVPTGEMSNLAMPNLDLRVERGLARRTLALGLHLALWNPDVSFGCCHGFGITVGNAVRMDDGPDELAATHAEMNNGIVSSAALTFRKEVKAQSSAISEVPCSIFHAVSECQSDGNATSSKQGKFSGQRRKYCCHCHGNCEGLMDALVSMWIVMMECRILSATFLVKELLTPWRWKLAMKSQPWEVSSSSWSVVVPWGMAQVVVDVVEAGPEGCIAKIETLLCDFLRMMSGMSELHKEPGNDATNKPSAEFPDTSNVALNKALLSVDELFNKELRRESQDRSFQKAEILALDLIMHVLEHYSPYADIGRIGASGTQPSLTSNVRCCQFLTLRNLAENLRQEHG